MKGRNFFFFLILILIFIFMIFWNLNILIKRINNQNNYKLYKQLYIKQSQNNLSATFISLVRNSEVKEIINSYKSLLEAFPNATNYPIFFLNDENFDENFKTEIMKQLNKFNEIYFEKVLPEHWEIPNWIDQEKMKDNMNKAPNYGYRLSVSYRQMCRFFSGFFFRHPSINKFDYYWRIEPGVDFLCKISFDPFIETKKNNYYYGFTIAIDDHIGTILTLGATVKSYIKLRNISVEDKIWKMLLDSNGDYNTCQFWSNFEIGNLNFFRTSEYIDYFNFLDKAGGFFYERWGDANVHTLAVGIFLRKFQVRFWDEIGYKHACCYHSPIKYISSPCKTSKDYRTDFSNCLKNWFSL